MAAALTCTECEDLMALAALGALNTTEAAVVDAHLRDCQRCTETSHALVRTAAALPESLDLLEPPAELRRRIMAQVYSTASADTKRKPLRRSWWWKIPQGRGITVFAGAAAAAAIAMAVLLLRPAGAPAEQRFPVTAAAADQSAHGELVYYASSSRAVLTVTGLTSSAASQVYEVWLISSGGSPQPVAFLSRAPAVDTWSAVVVGDLPRYTTLATTIEPAGGTSQPTGPQVFSVDLSHA